MNNKRDMARISAANIKNYDDQTFKDLYTNPGVTFFGSEADLAAVEVRAVEVRAVELGVAKGVGLGAE